MASRRRRIRSAMASIGCLLFIAVPTGASFAQNRLPPCPSDQTSRWDDCFGTLTSSGGGSYVGEFKNGKFDGQGTSTFPDGRKYVGEFKYGDWDGWGTYTAPNGEKYVGEFANGKRNGKGTSTLSDGSAYTGEFKDDKRSGQGTLSFANGETFVGEFKDGKRHGHGTFTFPDGEKYVGDYKDGKRNGQGVQTSADGTKYVGEFKDGKRNGMFTVAYANGHKYVGEFRDDKRNGQGTYTLPDGEKYVGEYKDDKRNGQGTQTFANGQKYIGEFKDGRRNGQGTYTFPSGEKYVGEFRDGKYNGQGTLAFRSGAKYVGEFKDDKRNGRGTYHFPDGAKYVGEFEDGNYNGLGVLFTPSGSVKHKGLWRSDKFVKSAAVPWLNDQQPVVAVPPAAPPQQSAAVMPQPPPAAPPAAAPSGKRVALVIGNARYKYSSILENPIRDAQLLASTLQRVGFQSVIVKTDLTREGLILALREFGPIADSADWALVYYSGHGVEFGGANYMIPIDAQLRADRDIDLETVNVGQVMNAIEGARRLRLVVLDACRDNPFASQMRRTMMSRSLGRGLARIEPEAGTLVVYAAKHGEVALDGDGRNSPFVDAMVKRIQQKPGVEIRRLFDLVRDDVVAITSRKQQPFSYGSISGSEDFYFTR